MSKQKKLVVPTKEEVGLFGNKIKIIKPALTSYTETIASEVSKPTRLTDRTELEVIPPDLIPSLSMGWQAYEPVGVKAVYVGTWIKTEDWVEDIKRIIDCEG